MTQTQKADAGSFLKTGRQEGSEKEGQGENKFPQSHDCETGKRGSTSLPLWGDFLLRGCGHGRYGRALKGKGA